jgi:hypothetical protein
MFGAFIQSLELRNINPEQGIRRLQTHLLLVAHSRPSVLRIARS